MEEDRRKHLEFIQNIITRMNSNSFMIKGWTITIVSALLVLFATIKVDSLYIITILPILIFWGLDAKYLQMERKFISLYKKATANPSTVTLFDMNIEEQSIKDESDNNYWKVLFSTTIIPFYLFLFLIVAGLCYFFSTKNEDIKKESISVSIKEPVNVKVIDTVSFVQKESVLKSRNDKAMGAPIIKK